MTDPYLMVGLQIESHLDDMIEKTIKSFNVVLKTFLEQLLGLFPNDSIMRTISDRTASLSTDPLLEKKMLIALKFISGVNQVHGATGRKVYELIADRDDQLFTNPDELSFALLKQLNFPEKWKQLTKNNRECVWKFFDRLQEYGNLVTILNASFMREIYKDFTIILSRVLRKKKSTTPTPGIFRYVIKKTALADKIRSIEEKNNFPANHISTFIMTQFNCNKQ